VKKTNMFHNYETEIVMHSDAFNVILWMAADICSRFWRAGCSWL